MPKSPWGSSAAPTSATPSSTPVGGQGSIDTINNADILSRDRKPDLIAQVRKELQDQTQLDAQASSLGVSATAYDSSVTALMAFLNALAPVRTNYLKRSHEIGASPWSQTNGGTGSAVVYTQNYATAPDGSTTATRIQANRGAGNTGSDYSVATQPNILTGDGTTARTESIWLKSNTGAPQKVYFGANGSGSVVDVTTTWQRFTRTYTPANALAVRLDVGSFGNYPAGTNSVDVLVWGGQYEDGSAATSNITTGAAAVTEGGWSDLGTDSDMGAGGDLTLRADLQSVATNRAALEKALKDKIQANAAYADALARSSNNLIRNGNSEDSNPSSFEAVGVTTGNAYTGSKCRSVVGTAGSTYNAITSRMPCAPGDQFYSEAWIKLASAAGSGRIVFQVYDASGSNIATYATSTTGTTSYAKVTGSCTIPANGATVEINLGTVAIGVGNTAYFDALYCCRMISTGMIQADAIQTSNYAEDGGGNPTAGARMDISSTALKVAANNLQIGPTVFSDYLLQRILQGLDGNTTNNRIFYRGNVDTSTRSGAPDITKLTVTPTVWDLAANAMWLDLKLAPTSPADNLDAMRRAEIQLYTQSARGTSGTLTAVGPVFKQDLTDRLYKSVTSDSDAGNVNTITAQIVHSSISSAYPAALVTLYNAYGSSAGGCFYAATGWTAGTALTYNGSSWPAGLTGGSGGGSAGGGGGGGGACPAPWVKIQLASGLLVDAADLYDGAPVAGVDEQTLLPAVGIVRAPSITWEDRVAVILEDGRAPEFSLPHRLMVEGRGWTEVRHLKPGDSILGQGPNIVRGLGRPIKAQVVKFQVDGCHTYLADGLVSHNVKILTP